MSDLVGNPEDRFSCVAAHMYCCCIYMYDNSPQWLSIVDTFTCIIFICFIRYFVILWDTLTIMLVYVFNKVVYWSSPNVFSPLAKF